MLADWGDGLLIRTRRVLKGVDIADHFYCDLKVFNFMDVFKEPRKKCMEKITGKLKNGYH